jgi:16S rRNA (adenine1518-N6/adenine1519-N6)-dimethyltransferase
VLRRSLGQHHLTRPEVCAPLLDFLRPEGRRVVEIGPGGGVLTRELLRRDARVLAIELDLAWACRLGSSEASPDLQLVVADALEFPWERLPVGTLVAGNLPYNVATPILQRLLRWHGRIERAAFLLQYEVAERLAAVPGTRAYGALSLLVQARAEVQVLGRVRPGAFRPPPKVDSAFVGLRLHAPPLPESEMPKFEAMVAVAFGQRRKTLRNALRPAYPLRRIDRALTRSGIEPGLRAEALALDAFVELHNNLCSSVTPD